MKMAQSDRQYSLGSMTGTVVDSAAKHIRQCKVNTDIMSVWATCDQHAMHQNKYKYITHKDDLVLNVTQKIGRALSNKLDVYPSVVSTFGDMNRNTQCAMMWLYDSSRPKDFLEKVQLIASSTPESFKEIVKWSKHKGWVDSDKDNEQLRKTLAKMPYLQAQGYAQTVGYATPISGDTVLSVLIGGLVTVRNGHFPMRCGQAVQWYFNFEKDAFSSQHTSNVLNEWDIGARLDNYEGVGDDLKDRRGKLEGHHQRNLFALPKPYVISSKTGEEFYGDKIRVFARCIGGGGPHEMVDLQLMTQSL
jgi:hypothetical protein